MRFPQSFTKLEKPLSLSHPRAVDMMRDVVSSLGHILSARAGYGPATPSFGVIGGVHGLRAMLCEMPRVRPDIAALIQHAICNSEPRLTDVVVTSVDQSDEPCDEVNFLLKARFTHSVEQFCVTLQLRPSGHMVLCMPQVRNA